MKFWTTPSSLCARGGFANSRVVRVDRGNQTIEMAQRSWCLRVATEVVPFGKIEHLSTDYRHVECPGRSGVAFGSFKLSLETGHGSIDSYSIYLMLKDSGRRVRLVDFEDRFGSMSEMSTVEPEFRRYLELLREYTGLHLAPDMISANAQPLPCVCTQCARPSPRGSACIYCGARLEDAATRRPVHQPG